MRCSQPFVRRIVARLNILNDNVDRLQTKRNLVSIDGKDEIAIVNKEFEQMAETLKSTNQWRHEYVSMISHDLRTPLTALQGSLALLTVGAYGAVPPTSENRIRTQSVQLGNLVDLVTDLLDLEKTNAKQMPLHMESFYISDITELLAEQLQDLAGLRGVTISVIEKNEEVIADSHKLKHVLHRLCKDALVRALPGTKMRIAADKSSDYFRVEITYEGSSVPNLHQQSFAPNPHAHSPVLTNSALANLGADSSVSNFAPLKIQWHTIIRSIRIN